MAGTELQTGGSSAGLVPEEIGDAPDPDWKDRIYEVHLEVERLRTEVAELAGDLRREMADLRSELRSEMADLRSELRSEIADLRSEMAEMRTEVHSEIQKAFADCKRSTHRWLAFGFSWISILIVLVTVLT